MQQHCIIIGGSHAAAQISAVLKQQKWEGDVTVISDDKALPYHRPPLSKAYLSGELPFDKLHIRPAAFYEKQGINFKLNTRATSVDKTAKTVTTSEGETLNYSHLVFATGAAARQLPLPGNELEGVYYLRDLNDADSLKNNLANISNVVIVGGGYIGLETAASLTKLGKKVTVLEAADRILQRVTAPEMSAFFKRVHTEEGVTVVEGASIAGFSGSDGKVTTVNMNDADDIAADAVIVGIGVIPNIALAETIGLECANGIVVNEFGQTSDEAIYAAGDCANHFNRIYDSQIRLESIQNANDQGKAVALAIAGKPAAYNAVPWFWSDQYDVKLQIAGLNTGYDSVVIRGNADEGRQFAAFYMKGDRVLAVDCINNPKVFLQTKGKLINACQAQPQQLQDETVELKDILV